MTLKEESQINLRIDSQNTIHHDLSEGPLIVTSVHSLKKSVQSWKLINGIRKQGTLMHYFLYR